MNRPAETAGAIGSAAVLIARLFGVKDADTLTGIGVVAGFIPAVVTWLVVTFHGRGKPAA